MVFSTILFLFYFLPVFLVGYNVLPQKLKNYWILLSSIVFYAWGAPMFIFVVLTSTIVDFQIISKMHRTVDATNKKRWLILSLVLNLGLLAYFKYANFFIENVNVMLAELGFEAIQWTNVVLPIGISFFIFQSITYAIDVYRGVNSPVKKFSEYLLYILSFPQMIAGPIVKFNDIASQLSQRNETIDDKLLGFYRFCIGLAKKVLIANVMAQQANLVLDGDVASLSSVTVWTGIIAYTFQIYFDFSGYSDMAIGLGRMMGFTFPENFNSPYLAKSISEFWRRWHMTLNAFMLHYLYIPLGGNRVSKGRMYFNLTLVFLLSGLWHGASWNFVLWGAFHGLFLILDRIFLVKLLDKLGVILSTITTFIVVMIGWAIFRMEDFAQMKVVLVKLFSFDRGVTLSLSNEFCIILVVAIFFSIVTAFEWGRKAEYFFFNQITATIKSHLLLIVVSFLLFVFSVAAIFGTDFNPFIYLRF